MTADGRAETVSGIVMMFEGANARDVIGRVEERVRRIGATLPAGVTIRPFYDRTELVERTMKTVERNLTEGAALVLFVLLLLLANWRGALLVATLVPLSMLFAAICMATFGVGGNLMSLGALDFGLIVAAGVFMVENAVRRRASAASRGRRTAPRRDDYRCLHGNGAAGTLRHGDRNRRVRADPEPDRNRRQDVPTDGAHGAVRTRRRTHPYVNVFACEAVVDGARARLRGAAQTRDVAQQGPG